MASKVVLLFRTVSRRKNEPFKLYRLWETSHALEESFFASPHAIMTPQRNCGLTKVNKVKFFKAVQVTGMKWQWRRDHGVISVSLQNESSA